MNRRGGRWPAVVSLAFVIALAGCAPADQNGDTVSLPAVVPLPASLEASSSPPFALSADTRITGGADAAASLSALLTARTGLTIDASTGSATGAPAIELTVDASTGSATRPEGGAAESYRIAVDAASVTVTGADDAGLFYGVQTLAQLVRRAGDGWEIASVTIDDAPRFAYRGVMLDIARHFHGVETIKAYIDRAASLKFNALHLHLSDDQGWRIEILSRPLLAELSSGSAVGGDPGGFLTQDDYRAIVDYAASKHMIVVPEIDVPGHTHAVSLAYPELCEEPVISGHIQQTADEYGGDLPVNGVAYDGMAVGFSSLRIHEEATYAFLRDVLGEIAALTPAPYLHIGGDEALGTDPADFAVFMERATAIVAELGKTPVTWHEAGAAAGLESSTIGQYWGFVTPVDGADDKARTFVANGSTVIVSPADAIYLDMKFDADSSLGLTWANGVTSAERAYSWEPSAIIAGIGDDDILGVEAPLWTETVPDLDAIDALAFPRIAAAAEAGWSPATGSSDLRTWGSFRERVGAQGPLWTSLGIGFVALDEIPWSEE